MLVSVRHVSRWPVAQSESTVIVQEPQLAVLVVDSQVVDGLVDKVLPVMRPVLEI